LLTEWNKYQLLSKEKQLKLGENEQAVDKIGEYHIHNHEKAVVKYQKMPGNDYEGQI